MGSHTQSPSPLRIGHLNPLSKGGHRTCYPHPEDPGQCIKILHQPWREIERRQRDPLRYFRRRRNYDENLAELLELQKLEAKLGAAMAEHFPICHGFVETDLGEGLAVEQIQDYDGSTSISLKAYLWTDGWNPQIKETVDHFWNFLKENGVLVRDPFPHNLLVQRLNPEGALRIKQIDGFGASDFLPFSRILSKYRNRKLDGRRKRMQRQITKQLERIKRGEEPKGKGLPSNPGH